MRREVLTITLVAVVYCVISTALEDRAGASLILCRTNDDCPENRVCRISYCIDPCLEVCGVNTNCHISRHVVIGCICLPGYTGDPFKICTQSGVKNNTNKEFYISKHKMRWADAVGDCYSRRMYMASINSLKEQFKLEDAMVKAGLEGEDVWLSLVWAKKLRRKDKLIWTATGVSGGYDWGLPFENFDRCKRSHGNCFVSSAYYEGKWCEASCNEVLHYACEFYK